MLRYLVFALGIGASTALFAQEASNDTAATDDASAISAG